MSELLCIDLAARHSPDPRQGFPCAVLADLLTAEHRRIEALWRAIEPGLERFVEGDPTQLDDAVLADLILRYDAHAHQEEAQFLPLAESILGRRSCGAVGVRLMRTRQLVPPCA